MDCILELETLPHFHAGNTAPLPQSQEGCCGAWLVAMLVANVLAGRRNLYPLGSAQGGLSGHGKGIFFLLSKQNLFVFKL